MTIIVTLLSDAPTTYQELQADVARWIARDDLTEEITRFIHFAESDICKDLRIREMEKTTTFSVTDAPLTLPTDFLGARRLYVDTTGDSRSLDYLSPEVFHRSRVFQLAGNPQAYTIEGENIKFAPLPGSGNPVDVKMLYLGCFEGLVNPTDSNTLLADHYNIYFYCALMHAYGFLRDDSEASKWETKYREYVAKLNRNANRERFHGNSLKRFGGPTP